MMKSNFGLLLLLLYAIALPAQKSDAPALPLPQTSIKASYLGTIVYPGFKWGIERPYKVIQVEKDKKWGLKTILKERYWTGNVGFYHHPTFHDNLFLLLERQKRRQSAGGWFGETSVGLGYSRSFLGGTTYTVAESGQVNEKPLAGYDYGMASLAAGGGYNFAMKKDIPFKVFGKISILGIFPYNSHLHLRPAIELGCIYSPAGFWKSQPNIKIKRK